MVDPLEPVQEREKLAARVVETPTAMATCGEELLRNLPKSSNPFGVAGSAIAFGSRASARGAGPPRARTRANA